MNAGTLTTSDKVGFMAGNGGNLSASNVSSNTDAYTKYAITQFYFKFGGYNYRSLINNASVTDILTNNFWDTIVPGAVINSVGAVLNINGFLITEITTSHSNLASSFIYTNTNTFQVNQNNTQFCSGSNNLLIAPSGGYTYQWYNNGLLINNSNNDTLQINSNGAYHVVITGQCSAISSAINIQLASGSPISVTSNGPTTFCTGGSVTLTSSSTSGNLWSNGLTSQSIIVSNSGSYTVTVTPAQGCPSVSTPTIITVNNLPAPPSISASGNTTFCTGGSITLLSNNPNVVWSNGSTNQNIVISNGGVYTAQTVSNGCSSAASNQIIVNVVAIPNSAITPSGPTTFCQGSNVTLNAVQDVGNSYQWYNNGSLIPNANNNNLVVSTTGTFSVYVTNGICNSTSNPIVVIVNTLPTSPSITASGNTTFCQGGNVSLNSNSSNVIWSNGSTNQNVTITSSGTYSAQTLNNGCLSVPSNQIVITVNPLPLSPIITPSGPTIFCTGNNVTLTSSYSSGNTWSNNQNTPSINVNSTGNYSSTVTDLNGCTSLPSNVISVTVNQTPNAPVITAAGATTFCSGGSVSITSNTSIGNNWINGETTQTINVTNSGNYYLTQTQNGCTSLPSNLISVTVNQTPNPPIISASGATTFCSGGSVNITSNTISGNNWINGETSQTINVTNSGNYYLTQTLNGCTSLPSNNITVTVNQTPNAPIITASGPTTFCQGSNVTLNTNYTNGLVWTIANGNQYPVQTLIVQSNQSSIFATVTINGCTSPQSQPVSTTVLPLVTPVFTQISPICSGESFSLPTISNNGITGIWSPVPNLSTTTTYTFTPTTGQCANSQSLTVVVNSLPNVTLSAFSSICDTLGNFNLFGGSPTGGTYSGNGVSNNIFNTNIGIGSYPITYSYTNSNGCSSSSTQNLSVISCQDASILINTANDVIIYPNPTKDFFILESLDGGIGLLYSLHDMSGRKLLEGTTFDNQTEINISNLSSGTYFLNISHSDKLIKIVKL
jgi:hypothetical protein